MENLRGVLENTDSGSKNNSDRIFFPIPISSARSWRPPGLRRTPSSWRSAAGRAPLPAQSPLGHGKCMRSTSTGIYSPFWLRLCKVWKTSRSFSGFSKLNLPEFEEEIGEYRVVANLPYYITTPLVTKLLEESGRCQSVSVMVQEEVAERFCAKAGTPEYGAITAAIALKGEARIVKRVPRTLFYPRPNVDSAVVRIDFRRGRLSVRNEEMYRKTVRCAFSGRRKRWKTISSIRSLFPENRRKTFSQKRELMKRPAGRPFRPNSSRFFRIFFSKSSGNKNPEIGREQTSVWPPGSICFRAACFIPASLSL